MKVIIVGAGNVGYTSAEALSKSHDVLVIEKDADTADNAKNLLSISVLHEDGSNPRVLEKAIERINAEIIISAVPEDGLNLFICMMAKRIKPELKTVACVRDPDYVTSKTRGSYAGVDLLISPELIMANKVTKLAVMENVISYDNIESMGLALATFKIEREHDFVGKVILDLPLPQDCSIIAIYRGDNIIVNNETAQIHVDDRICILGRYDALDKINKLIGVRKEAKEFVILGASIVGIRVAKLLSGMGKRFIKIIDKDESNCRNAARELEDVIVVNADIADPITLKIENVQRADVIISVSNMDERNLLACMAALKFNTMKIVSRYSTKEYEEIFKYTGIESIIGYHRVITNEITKNLVFDENSIIMMEHENELFFSASLDNKSKLTNNYLGDVTLPPGMKIGAIVREDKIIFPKMDTMLMENDKILIFTHLVDPVKLSKLLGHVTLAEL